jgi:hypothetical protein
MRLPFHYRVASKRLEAFATKQIRAETPRLHRLEACG